jgi:hypothetical protein
VSDAEFVASAPVLDAGHSIKKDAFSPNYFKRFFIEEKELGRGGKGVVLLVRHELDRVSLGTIVGGNQMENADRDRSICLQESTGGGRSRVVGKR